MKVNVIVILVLLFCKVLPGQNTHTIDSLVFLYEEQWPNDNPAGSINLSIQIARQYEAFYPDSGLAWIERGLVLAPLLQDDSLTATLHYYRSYFQFLNNRYEAAVLSALMADSLLKSYEHHPFKALNLYSLAEGYEYTGRSDLAIKTYDECYRLAASTNNTKILVRLDWKMGNMKKVSGEPYSALSYYKKAISRLDSGRTEDRRLYLGSILTYCYLVLNDDKGIFSAEKPEACANLQNNKQLFFEYNMAQDFTLLEIKCTLWEGDLKKIKAINIPKLEDIKKSTTNPIAQAQHVAQYVEVALKSQRLPTALRYNNEALQIARASDNKLYLLLILQQRKEVLLALEDYKSLAAVQDEILSLEKVFFDLEREKSLEGLSSRLSLKEKELELKLIAREKDFLTTINRWSMISIISLLVILAVITGFVIRLKKDKKTIQQQRTKLKQLNQTKDHIFAIIGHDMRKPVLSFRGIARKVNYLLKEKDFATLNAIGEQIERNAQSLSKLTDNLLNWALLQRDALTLHLRPIPLAEAVQDVTELFQGIADDKKVSLDVCIPAHLSVLADLSVLQTILRNLLDNAIKFTPEGGKVSLIAKATQKGIQLTLADTGIGMSNEQLKNIFTIQKNKSTTGTSGETGSGLGLYLAKKMIEMNQGHLEVNSQPNVGTTCILTFPNP
jgi:signal transduction histidine kinase